MKEQPNALDEYQKRSERTWRAGSNEKFNAALGLAGESGEVLEWIKKVEFHGKQTDREALKLELGDVLYYLARLADIYGFRLSTIADANEAKLRSRYPEGFPQPATTPDIHCVCFHSRDLHSVTHGFCDVIPCDCEGFRAVQP